MYNKLISSSVLCALLGAANIVFGMELALKQPEFILGVLSNEGFEYYNAQGQKEIITNRPYA